METLASIFARGGSKGLPGKNLLPLMGKPLLVWAIEQAQAVKDINRVIVSTDSPAIAEMARKHGAEVPFLRPAELSMDTSAEWLAWRHALEWIRKETGKLPDAMVVVPTTSPLRLPSDIEAALERFAEGNAEAVLTVTPARRNPCFNMVQKNCDGTVRLILPLDATVSRRQDAPEFYDISTLAYVVAPSFVLSSAGLFAGRVRVVEVPAERAVDIDNLTDFEFAEFLMQRRQNKT